MRNHPGDVLQEMLDELGTTQSDLARRLGTDVARVNEICRHRQAYPHKWLFCWPKAFGTSPGLWLNLQKNWELSQVDPRATRAVRPLCAKE